MLGNSLSGTKIISLFEMGRDRFWSFLH